VKQFEEIPSRGGLGYTDRGRVPSTLCDSGLGHRVEDDDEKGGDGAEEGHEETGQSLIYEFLGDHTHGETPVPIPNTEAKPVPAD
jgi:hypothetical protein